MTIIKLKKKEKKTCLQGYGKIGTFVHYRWERNSAATEENSLVVFF